MSGRIRIGIVGAGSIVRERHLPNLQKIAGVEVVAVCNRREETAQEVARAWGIPRVVRSWEEIVTAEDIDAVLIGTPPHLHREVSIAALEAGKHVFCQARMAMDAQQAREMAAAAQRAAAKGLKAQLCLCPHCLAVDGVVRRLLHEEELLGTFTHGIVAVSSDRYLDPAAPLHWRQVWRISGFNTLELGMYAEVLHRWLGPFRRVQAMEHTVTRYRPAVPGGRLLPVERPDMVSITAEHSTGAIVTIHMSGVSRPHTSFIELHGTKGSLRHVIGEEAVSINRGAGWQRIELTPEEITPWTAEADFIRSIREDLPIQYPNPSFLDGLRYMEFTEAVFRSAREGRAVALV